MGILRAHSLSQLFDLAITLSSQPVPKGENVGVVTNAGGPGVLTADAVETSGLKMASLSPETLNTLRKNLPEEAAVNNPVDVVGDADINRYSFALRTVLKDPNVNSMIAMIAPVAVLPPDSLADLLISVRNEGVDKPMIGVLVGGPTMKSASDRLLAAGIPTFTFPEDGVETILGLTKYAKILELPINEQIPKFIVDKRKVEAVIEAAKIDGRATLLGSEAMAVAEAYGINVPPTSLLPQASRLRNYPKRLAILLLSKSLHLRFYIRRMWVESSLI